MALNAIAIGAGTQVNGRALALGAISLDSNDFYSAPPVVTISKVAPAALSDGARTVTAAVTDPAGNAGTASQSLTVDTTAPVVSITGGPNALTNNPTPDISGTANVALGTPVAVTVANQTLTGLVQGRGAWSVTAAHVADGPHRLIMSVSDAAGNPASSTQMLTVDTVPPLIMIDGGATATTSNHHPTIAGTANAAPGSTVTMSIAGQTLTTLLQANGTWNATPTFVGTGHVASSRLGSGSRRQRGTRQSASSPWARAPPARREAVSA